MFEWLKRLTRSRFYGVEQEINEILKKRGRKIDSIFWDDDDIFRENDHIYHANFLTVDLVTKKVTTNDVVKYGHFARDKINHLKEDGYVTYNSITGKIVVQTKKGEPNSSQSNLPKNPNKDLNIYEPKI